MPTAKAGTFQRDQQPAYELWVDDSGASENSTAGATGSETCERAPPGDGVESADDKLLPGEGYERLRLLVIGQEATPDA